MDDAMSALFRTRLDDALEESESSAILIRAAGKSFCSGRDTQVLGHRARDESDFHFVRRHQEGRLRMQESTKPIVAALKGGVIGGGCELALAADIRVSDTTLKLALPEILYGVLRSEEHTSELQSLMRTSYAVFCLKKK